MAVSGENDGVNHGAEAPDRLLFRPAFRRYCSSRWTNTGLSVTGCWLLVIEPSVLLFCTMQIVNTLLSKGEVFHHTGLDWVAVSGI